MQDNRVVSQRNIVAFERRRNSMLLLELRAEYSNNVRETWKVGYEDTIGRRI
jgi:hypothetical protein